VDLTKMNFFQRLRYLINLPQSLRLVWRLILDKRVPAANKGLFTLVVLFYIVIPADLLPDFIPFVGQLDDLGVLLFLAERFIRYAPANVVADYFNARPPRR